MHGHMFRQLLGRYKRISLLFGAIFCCVLLIGSMLAMGDRFQSVIRSDGRGYYLYLPSLFIHQDMRMQWTEPRQALEPGPEWSGVSKFSEHNYLNKYPMGLSLLWMPFFLTAHLMTYATGQPTADGFSAWYQGSVVLAAAFYTALGCVLLYKTLRRYFPRGVSYITVTSLLLGTNMLSYATYDASFTHVYTFCIVSALLYITPLWYKSMTWRSSVLLGALLGIATIMRPTNSLIAIIILLWNITDVASAKKRLTLFWKRRLKLLALAGAAFVIVLPQLAYWKYITGSWIVFSYRGEGFDFLHPEIINILFSADRGVLFWAPILLLAVTGLILLRRGLKQWAFAIYIFLPIWLWTTASWHSWQFGMSYGHRAFIDIFPLLALAIGALLVRLKAPVWRWTIGIFIFACIVHNLFMSYQYWIQALPGAEMSLGEYAKVWKHEMKAFIYGGLHSGFLSLLGVTGTIFVPLTYIFMRNRRTGSALPAETTRTDT